MKYLLVKKAKCGDTDAFCKLIDAEMQSLYKIASAYLSSEDDIADAVQETILTCFEKLHTLKKDQYFKTWMIRILINNCKDMIQKGKRVVYMDHLPEMKFEESGYSKSEWVYLLTTLDEKYRTILLLYYLEGFNIKEISTILDMNENTVKSHLKRGREKIAKQQNLLGREVSL